MERMPFYGIQSMQGESALIYQKSCANTQQPFPRQTGCHCPSDGTIPALPEDAAVTMAYVPFQTDNGVYEPLQALSKGTAFPVLDKPFLAGCIR